MKNLVLCLTLLLLFFINNVYSSVTINAKYENNNTLSVTFKYKQNLGLECTVIATEDEHVTVKWEKNGTELEKIEALKGRVRTSDKEGKYKLTVLHTVEDDAGEYSCVAYVDDERKDAKSITVSAQIGVKVQSNINVVEGEKLRIHCNVIGKPTPTLSWYYSNDTYNQTYTESMDRVILEEDSEKKIPNSILRIDEIQMFDRGVFTCIATSKLLDKPEKSECMVRVKDKYAALWPFLGICAEVFILCAIIFIYEKKRNKTELEESDTDQSPDQKNTPDHGKDSNLRHRQ